jgi:hypothetical protein
MYALDFSVDLPLMASRSPSGSSHGRRDRAGNIIRHIEMEAADGSAA